MSVTLPSGVRKQAFQAFARIIMTDPVLKREVKQWRVWDGSHGNEEPAVGELPCVQLRMTGGSIERLCSDGDLPNDVTLRTSPSILIDIWVAGTDAGVLMDVYDTIDRALFPQDDAAMTALQGRLWEVGIMDVVPTQDVMPRGDADYTAQGVHGQGCYQLTLVLTQ